MLDGKVVEMVEEEEEEMAEEMAEEMVAEAVEMVEETAEEMVVAVEETIHVKVNEMADEMAKMMEGMVNVLDREAHIALRHQAHCVSHVYVVANNYRSLLRQSSEFVNLAWTVNTTHLPTSCSGLDPPRCCCSCLSASSRAVTGSLAV